MPIDMQWDDDAQTVLRYLVVGDWTAAEFRASFDQGRLWTQEREVFRGIIVEVSDAAPPGLSMLAEFRRMMTVGRIGVPVVLVGVPETGRKIFHVIHRAFPASRSAYFTETIEQARALLRDLSA